MDFLGKRPEPVQSTTARGQQAEDAALSYLLAKGLRLVERNYRTPGRGGGEIDLIARAGATIVFIEVKCAETLGLAAERLQQRQMDRIYASASAFLSSEPDGQDSDVRLDLALVDADGRIEIIENAFLV